MFFSHTLGISKTLNRTEATFISITGISRRGKEKGRGEGRKETERIH
jgi:hypothetical protein